MMTTMAERETVSLRYRQAVVVGTESNGHLESGKLETYDRRTVVRDLKIDAKESKKMEPKKNNTLVTVCVWRSTRLLSFQCLS